MPIVNTDPNRNVQPSVDLMDVLVRISGLEKSSLVYRDDEAYPVARRLAYEDGQDQQAKQAINRLNKDGLICKSSERIQERHPRNKKQLKVKKYTIIVTEAGQAALST